MSHTMNPRQVLLNILQLKVAVLLKKTGTDDRQGQREYLALLNEKIGAMFFAKSVLGWNELYEKIQDLGEDEKDWRRVRLRVNRKRTESDNFFLVDENDHKLDTNNLSDTARRVAELTLRLLNHKSKQVKHIEGPIENIVLED